MTGAELVLAAVGDLVLDDRITPVVEAQAPALVSALRRADTTIGNFETTAIDFDTFTGWPEAEPGGSWLVSSPSSVDDLRDLGIDMVSRANNHATDWGVAGLLSTSRALDSCGIVHAGAGRTLTGAREPAYRTTRAGRVALVSAATRYQPMSRASDPMGPVPGRPGINGIRTRKVFRVPPADMRAVRAIHAAQRPESLHPATEAADARNGTTTIGDTTFLESDGLPGPDWSLHEDDVHRFRVDVRQAAQTADVVAVALHTHEPGNWSDRPPRFLEELAHLAIDEGADLILGHGPHRVRGIEIYRSRPVFYSLGNFAFLQNRQFPLTPETWQRQGASPETHTTAEVLELKRTRGVFAKRVWFESFVPEIRFVDGVPTHVSITPIDLTYDADPVGNRGIPRLCEPGHAGRVLHELHALSRAYGTDLKASDGTASIEI
ncbi:CapA family protein [Pseudonocardia alni]|uniref:CapA family protein n=1 Tax=Pseudonocardia alni TaxID=33907 RepID=UPI0033C00595